MSWRERIAKMLAQGVPVRTDLPTRAYHGSTHTFDRFVTPPVDSVNLDRGLGVHLAADPALASSFPRRAITEKRGDPSGYSVKQGAAPQVYPVAIPPEHKFLQVSQPSYWDDAPHGKEWMGIKTDERAVEEMMTAKAYREDPALLERYLREARAMQGNEAQRAAQKMASGEGVILGLPHEAPNPYTLDQFISNYGGRPYNQRDREAVTDIARGKWQDEGHAGLRYINTSPREAGAKGVVDQTSYIVFDPKDIRSQFARFDPAKADSGNLLSSVAGMAAVPAGIGALVDQSTYGARQ
jgi:hypothetical protein